MQPPVVESVNLTWNAIDTFTLTYTAGAGGTLTGETPQTVDYGGSGTEVTAVPGLGYHFVDRKRTALPLPRRWIPTSRGNVNVTANFVIDTFTLTYTAGAGGTLTRAICSIRLTHGTAARKSRRRLGWATTLWDWSDSVATISRTDTNVTGNVNVTALRDRYLHADVHGGCGWHAHGETPQTVDYGGSGTEVTAAPGWATTSWTGVTAWRRSPGRIPTSRGTSMSRRTLRSIPSR